MSKPLAYVWFFAGMVVFVLGLCVVNPDLLIVVLGACAMARGLLNVALLDEKEVG